MKTANTFYQHQYNGIRRFLEVQPSGGYYGSSYDRACKEIVSGRKETCWIWYVFPQLLVLGHSSTAKYFGIKDLSEACEYLCDPILSQRYLAILLKVNKHFPRHIEYIMGWDVDAKKFVSSLTLFQAAARHLLSKLDGDLDEAIASNLTEIDTACQYAFSRMATQGYGQCQQTLAALSQPINDHVDVDKSAPALLETPLLAQSKRTFVNSQLEPAAENFSEKKPGYLEWLIPCIFSTKPKADNGRVNREEIQSGYGTGGT